MYYLLKQGLCVCVYHTESLEGPTLCDCIVKIMPTVLSVYFDQQLIALNHGKAKLVEPFNFRPIIESLNKC